MKKIITLIMVLAIAVTFFAGCFAGGTTETRDVSGSQGTGTTGAGGQLPVNTEPEQVAVEETVICDQNSIKITVTGMEESWTGLDLKVLVENNTDKNIVFSADLFVINGITVSGFGFVDVAAGKKSNDVISFLTTDLEVAGIDSIATIVGCDAHIIDSDSYETLYETPFSITTSLGSDYVQPINDTGDVVYQEAGITVIAQKYTSDIWGPAIRLLVKNECGKDVILSAENISVNGYTVSAWLYDIVYQDTVRYCELDIFNSELEENEIEAVETVTFSLEVIDKGTLERIAESEELEIKVSE